MHVAYLPCHSSRDSIGQIEPTYDLVVIGAGSAGLVAAPFAGAVGAKVLLVEKDRIGGDCTWTGCVPSKALIHTAGIVHCLRDAVALVGGASAPKPDAGRIMARVRAAIDGVHAFERADALARQCVEVAFGAARFLDNGTIAIGDRLVTSRHFVICTGANQSSRLSPGSRRRRF